MRSLHPLVMSFEGVMTQKSGRSYSNRTLKILWGRAAGRYAVPSYRIELYADATDYDTIGIIGEIAHIEASSDSGPRANKTLAKKSGMNTTISFCFVKTVIPVLMGKKIQTQLSI
ncbi:hypothetical protein NDI44_25870 [Trichocoleus sp. DQ-A3]|uniref:hypothetical protein n=2 Tax=Cyanobacteriota TaxID=1117 RepID=UPI00199F77E5|nr:hypothetical protein [Coleofasciculus sp. FACHB-125]